MLEVLLKVALKHVSTRQHQRARPMPAAQVAAAQHSAAQAAQAARISCITRRKMNKHRGLLSGCRGGDNCGRAVAVTVKRCPCQGRIAAAAEVSRCCLLLGHLGTWLTACRAASSPHTSPLLSRRHRRLLLLRLPLLPSLPCPCHDAGPPAALPHSCCHHHQTAHLSPAAGQVRVACLEREYHMETVLN